MLLLSSLNSQSLMLCKKSLSVLTQWAASLIQKFMKRRKSKRSSLHEVGLPATGSHIRDGDLPKDETTPLLKY